MIRRYLGAVFVTAGFLATASHAQRPAKPVGPITTTPGTPVQWKPLGTRYGVTMSPGEWFKVRWFASGGWLDGYFVRTTSRSGALSWALWSKSGTRQYPAGTRIWTGDGDSKDVVVTLQPVGVAASGTQYRTSAASAYQHGGGAATVLVFDLGLPKLPRGDWGAFDHPEMPSGAPSGILGGAPITDASYASFNDGQSVDLAGSKRLIRISGALYVQQLVAGSSPQTLAEYPVALGSAVVKLGSLMFVGEYAGAVMK